MKCFSLRRVAEYMRYNYTVQSKSYIWNLLALFAVPLMFAILSKSAYTAANMSTFVYMVAAWVFPVREVWLMRNRGTKIMSMTLPVSTEERWVAMLVTLVVVFPVVAILTSVLAILSAMPFDKSGVDVVELIAGNIENIYLKWPIYVLVQLFASVSLFMVSISRRSILLTYVAAVAGIVAFLYSTSSVLEYVDWHLDIGFNHDAETAILVLKIIYCAIPVLFYALSYVALKHRQVKW